MRPLAVPSLAAAMAFAALSLSVASDANADARAGLPNAAADASKAPVLSETDLRYLLARLAAHGARFEQMKRRGSFTLSGHLDELDGDGRVDATKEIVVRVTADGAKEPVSDIVRYVEDGQDKTAEARAKALEDAGSKAKDKRRDFRLPFAPYEQERYVFTVVERAKDNPRRLRIAFTPKSPAEDAYKGSAWVDVEDAEVESLGFSLSRNPNFVDHVDVTMLFALRTPLGRAPSKMTIDAHGKFLFVKKHYRGEATISDARIAP